MVSILNYALYSTCTVYLRLTIVNTTVSLTPGPRVDYTEIVVAHLRALSNGEVDGWGDPATTESLPITTPEPLVQ
jgi:hypothetical protein